MAGFRKAVHSHSLYNLNIFAEYTYVFFPVYHLTELLLALDLHWNLLLIKSNNQILLSQICICYHISSEVFTYVLSLLSLFFYLKRKVRTSYCISFMPVSTLQYQAGCLLKIKAKQLSLSQKNIRSQDGDELFLH